MVTFEEAEKRGIRRRSKGGDSRSNNRRDSGDRRGRNSGRSSYGDRRGNRDSRRRVEKTRVKCSSCGTDCEVPFVPTSNKPIYCDECFMKKGAATANKISENDLDIINEKLNKIMKALKIE